MKVTGRGPRHVGVGLAHQRRGHVAGAVLDIEPAGNLDFLHVLPGRNRDPGQPLHRLVLLRRRLDEVDPDRIVRQRREVGGVGSSSGRIRQGTYTESMGNSGTGAVFVLTRFLTQNRHLTSLENAMATQRHLTRFWQALDDGALTAVHICGDGAAQAWPRFGGSPSLPRNQPEPQYLRHKRHSRPAAAPNRPLSAGIIGRFLR